MLSFGYFSLHKQRKVTRARKGVKAVDLLFQAHSNCSSKNTSEGKSKAFGPLSGVESLSLLVQRSAFYGSRRLTKVTKETHPVLAPSALQVRRPSGNFSKGRPCPFEKRRASMRAAPAGFDPNGLPLRYGAPDKLEAKAKQKGKAKSGKRS
ncbi:hypothetical protein [Xanthomonas bromi]|uniref:hypothetical protein n=1 Tax=Xanthomonas bromi TaxID=56449 RepID=UPI0015E362EC|nr:hypothetical protein [Xanthomonas bromi]